MCLSTFTAVSLHLLRKIYLDFCIILLICHFLPLDWQINFLINRYDSLFIQVYKYNVTLMYFPSILEGKKREKLIDRKHMEWSWPR